jgi:carbon monoxide dehydrogenase subunit G
VEYRFLTTWLLEAPRPAVWDVLEDASAWPDWWPGVMAMEEVARKAHYRAEWRSRIPYPVRFDFVVDRVDGPAGMSGHATGDLEGTGEWRLFEHGGLTAVTYDWRVRATKPWMKLAGPVARPVFEWNHDYVMRGGGEALAAKLGTTLLAQS